MSDFDKEAEREKLREKYGDEGEDRETTQQMSELLLQGATMTNRHCDECGDPIFRHEGQEFCPTCQSVEGEAAGDADERSGQESEGGSQTGEPAPRTAGVDGELADGASASPGAPTGSDRPEANPRTATTETPPSRQGDQSANRRDAQAGSQSDHSATGGDLAEAQRSLARTLARFARQAEAADDPRAAKEHLAAAREAAEALSALRR